MQNQNKKKKSTKKGEEEITRRQAIGKMGYAAFASTTLFVLLNNPTRADQQSPNSPGNPGGDLNSGEFDFGSDQNNTQDEWGTGDNDDWK